MTNVKAHFRRPKGCNHPIHLVSSLLNIKKPLNYSCIFFISDIRYCEVYNFHLVKRIYFKIEMVNNVSMII